VNERLLAEKLDELEAAIPGELPAEFEEFVRTASDDALVRINPVRFAQRYDLSSARS
jgi:hypothetical protein